MKNYTDLELADMAEWAENEERQMAPTNEARKAFGAIRQGIDWLLRYRVRERQREIEKAGSSATVRTQ